MRPQIRSVILEVTIREHIYLLASSDALLPYYAQLMIEQR